MEKFNLVRTYSQHIPTWIEPQSPLWEDWVVQLWKLKIFIFVQCIDYVSPQNVAIVEIDKDLLSPPDWVECHLTLKDLSLASSANNLETLQFPFWSTQEVKLLGVVALGCHSHHNSDVHMVQQKNCQHSWLKHYHKMPHILAHTLVNTPTILGIL